jgi:hypothetical protein
MADTEKSPDRSRWFGLFLTIFIVALIGANVAVALGLLSTSRTLLWVMNIVLITLFLVVMGKAITRRFMGFLIDDRLRRISLSRFQLVLWTIVILPALLTIIVFNLVNAPEADPESQVKDDPLNVQVPPEVLGLLGISVASLAGSQYIKDQNVNQSVLQKVEERKEEVQGTASPQGSVSDPSSPAPNSSALDARFADMFRGETESSKDFLEIGKVQMFFFTLIVALGYAIAVGDGLGNTDLKVIEKMPDLTAGMLVLLGISQVGYIANKAVTYYSPPSADGAIASEAGPNITNVRPNPINFDQAQSIEITGTNFGEDPNTPSKGIVFLDGRPLEAEEWTPVQIRARLPVSKQEAEKLFVLPSYAEVWVQDHSGRRSPPASDKVSLT